MGHKGEILFAAPLHLLRTLRGIGLHGQADGMVEDPVDNVERRPLQVHRMLVGQRVYTAAQQIIFRNHLFDIKSIHETLSAMDWGGSFSECFRDGLVRPFFEGLSEFVEQSRNVIVENRHTEPAR